MDLTSAWHAAFAAWPADLPRAGIVVAAPQETIPFVDFLLAESFIILERDKPDSQGGRKFIVALAAITAVKLTIPDPLARLQPFAAGSAAAAAPSLPGEPPLPPGGTLAARAAAARRPGDLGRRSL